MKDKERRERERFGVHVTNADLNFHGVRSLDEWTGNVADEIRETIERLEKIERENRAEPIA